MVQDLSHHLNTPFQLGVGVPESVSSDPALLRTCELHGPNFSMHVNNRYRLQTERQQRMLEYWGNPAHNLIEHFRAVCRGQIPFNMEWNSADQDAAEVDDQSLLFIHHLRSLVSGLGQTIGSLALLPSSRTHQPLPHLLNLHLHPPHRLTLAPAPPQPRPPQLLPRPHDRHPDLPARPLPSARHPGLTRSPRRSAFHGR